MLDFDDPWLRAAAWVFVGVEWSIRAVMLVVVPVRRPPESAKSWLLLIMFEPVLGLVLFWILGSNKLPRWRQEMIRNIPNAFARLRKEVQDHPRIEHPELSPELHQAVTLAESLGQLPILGDNSAELLSNYKGVIDRLVADIDAAKHHVHLLFYIFADDKTAGRVIDALIRAQGRGVKCRVLVDSVGSRRYLSALAKRLTSAGIELQETLPVGIMRWLRFKSARYDLRNHRKIAVIDGQIGYTGSQNLVDAKFKEGITYEELMVRVTGPIVLELQYTFVTDWYIESDQVLDGPEFFPDPQKKGELLAQALPSGPGYPTENNQRLVVALIHAADKKVVITTPYFVPDEPLLQAMQTAVMRGVEVHLIVSEKADQLLVSLAQRSYYEQLMEWGVQIHLFRKKFLHAKYVSVDDELAVIGSSNMDYRSFSLNAEISLIFYDRQLALALGGEIDKTMRRCRRLDPEVWKRRAFFRKVGQGLARLLGPVL